MKDIIKWIKGKKLLAFAINLRYLIYANTEMLLLQI
jgi:hypothetical protein